MKGIMSVHKKQLYDKAAGKTNVGTPYSMVKYVLDLDTVIDDEELILIRKDRYSRKPIVLNKHDPVKK
jgi:hypothetical protein